MERGEGEMGEEGYPLTPSRVLMVPRRLPELTSPGAHEVLIPSLPYKTC